MKLGDLIKGINYLSEIIKMKTIIAFGFTLVLGCFFSQSPAHVNGIRSQVQLINGDTDLSISWDQDSSATGYTIYRKLYGASNWGPVYASLPAYQFSYTDTNVIAGTIYEYRVLRTTATTGFAYTCGTIDGDIDFNPGRLVLVIDDYFLPALALEIDSLITDLQADAWFIDTVIVTRNQSPIAVKNRIWDIYNLHPASLKSVFLLGHVPVPYSGEINPDGHPDHLGAWPADGYYGDMNGTWTDVSVNNSSAASPRNQNIPGDGKFDQSVFQSGVELEVARVDFYDLTVFAATETQLMSNYLSKLKAFKHRTYIPPNTALVEDNFLGLAEGFAGSGYIGLSPIVGIANTNDGDYSQLQNQDYLWSYGTGPGSYSSASGIVTTPDFASNAYRSTFTMLFGSYFGDWDAQNNLLKAALASGKVLAASWSGRPYLYYHPMGVGENLGACIRLSQNNTNAYLASTLGYFQRWIHISQLGDPSLRAHYVEEPSDLVVYTQNDGTLQLTWNPPGVSVDGFHVYRHAAGVDSWTKLTNAPILSTSFSDLSLPAGGAYTYMVRSARKQTAGSGRYWNQSLGIQGEGNSTLSQENAGENAFSIWPNPSNSMFYLQAQEGLQFRVYDAQGRTMMHGISKNDITEIDARPWNPGVYLISVGNSIIRLIKS